MKSLKRYRRLTPEEWAELWRQLPYLASKGVRVRKPKPVPSKNGQPKPAGD